MNTFLNAARFIAAAAMVILGLAAPSIAHAAPGACPRTPNVEQLFGQYEVVGYERYGGSLLSEAKVAELAKSGLVLRADHFRLHDSESREPYYEIQCKSAFVEGEVPSPSDRLSNFYGFGIDRKVIVFIDVYLKLGDPYPFHRLELAGDEMWELYAGWFFRMKRVEK